MNGDEFGQELDGDEDELCSLSCVFVVFCVVALSTTRIGRENGPPLNDLPCRLCQLVADPSPNGSFFLFLISYL